jgi:hypothetical protein
MTTDQMLQFVVLGVIVWVLTVLVLLALFVAAVAIHERVR